MTEPRSDGLVLEVARQGFERLTRLATRLLDAPVAQINIVTRDRQVTLSCAGPESWREITEVPLSHSYCQHVIAKDSPLLIEDAREHPLVRDNLATVESGIVAYASLPVHGPAGDVLATLCVFDFEPRKWDEEDKAALRDLVGSVEAEIALRHEALLRERSERERAAAAEALQRTKEALEERVSERTAELAAANEALARRMAELQSAEEQLRESEHRYRSLFEYNPHATYLIDREGTIIAANQAVADLIGAPREEIEGRPFMPFIAPDELAHMVEKFAAVLAGEAQTYESAVMRADGRRAEILGVSAPLLIDGRVEGVIGVAQDVTERRSLEMQFRQAQKMEAVGRLAGGVAHDFNNILTAIGGFAQLALEDLPAADPLREDIDEIVRAARRANDLTRQLLMFSRRQVATPAVLDPGEVVRGAEKMLGRLLGEDIELEVVVAPDVGRISADPTHMEQVLVNLAVNARDAMPGGGRLTIEAQNVESPARCVRFSVTDDGHGMSVEVRERVFEPFFTTKPAGEGTGLGLSTVYGIVKQSGGEVRVRSEEGVGTTFEFDLPRVEDAATPVPDQDPEAEGVAGAGTVLLVEDQRGVRAFTRRALERAGYRVLDAASGAEALQLWEERSNEVDLLLTDVVMPQMGGGELAERLRQSRPDLPVLYMSGYAEEHVVGRGVLAPGTELIEKPFEPKTLQRRVREVIAASSSAGSA